MPLFPDEGSDNSKSARVQPSAFQRLLGINQDQVRPDLTSSLNPIHTARYSNTEQTTFFKDTFVKDVRSPSQTHNTQGLLNIFLPVHEEIGQILFNLEKLRVLAPEIDQAAMIRISSIMSPNDLQDGVFKFTLDNLPNLDKDVSDRICAYITDYFDKVIGLGQKSEKWVKDCLYGVGCTPIFLFPTTHFQAFRKDGFMVADGAGGIQASTETLEEFRIEQNQYYRKENYEELFKAKIYSGNRCGLESIKTRLNKKQACLSLYQQVYSDMLAIDPEFFYATSDQKDQAVPADIVTAIEKIRVTLTKELEEGDGIRLSENPEIVKFAGEYRKRTKENLRNVFDQTFDNSPTNYQIDRGVSIQKYDINDEREIGHPYYIVLPPESIVPLTVPGNERQHLGYILLVDDFGHPLRAQDTEANAGCGAPNVSAAYNAMFRGVCADSRNGTDRYGKAMASSVFDHLLDQYIKAKLQDIGHDNIDVHKANGIATTMFYRLLEHKRTDIVFIPEHLMTYMAFDYRKDGTGRSLLEDIQFILSLRATFMVASVMAMANDAINHHTLGVTFDEKTVNPEQILEDIGNQFIDKRRMRLSIDPADISRSIARNSITIIPKNLPGLSGFEVENNVSSGSSTKPDNELIDHFNNMLVTALGVPYAALNQLGETEYSRSIVTTNLFFSKQIRRDQRQLCDHINNFVREYIRYSKPLKEGIISILHNKGRIASSVNELDNAAKKIDDNGTANVNTSAQLDSDQDVARQLSRIIEHLTATLPTPNLAPDKAQYEELRTFVDTVTNFANLVFAPELVPQDDMQAQTGLNIAKAHWIKDQCVELYEQLGSFNTLSFPSVDDLGLLQMNWADVLQAYKNFGKFIQETTRQLTADGDGGGGLDMGMGGEDTGMGDDEDMGMGSDDMGGGSDDDFAAPEDEPNPSEANEPKPTSNQGMSQSPEKASTDDMEL